MMLQIRSSQAALASVCQHIGCLFLTVVCLKALPQPLYLHSSILNALISVVHPGSWVCLAAHCTVFISFTLLHSMQASVEPVFWKSRWSLLRYLFGGTSLLTYCSVGLVGLVYAWSCAILSTGDYSSPLMTSCKDNRDKLCFNQKHNFLVLSGLCTALWWLRTYLNGGQYIKFPDIQRHKSSRLLDVLLPGLITSAQAAIKPVLCYYVLYYLKGGQLRDALIQGFGFAPVVSPLDTVWGLLDLQLFLSTWTISTSLLFSFQITLIIFTLFYTEPLQFTLEEGDNNRLIDAMKSKDGKGLLSCLAYLDLFNISERGNSRRNVIFTLSQPGGHPRIWKEISVECLTLLKDFNNSLNSLLAPNISVSTKTEEIKSVNTATIQSPKFGRPLIVSWNHIPSEMRETGLLKYLQRLLEQVLSIVNKMREYITKIPVIYYVFGELPAAAENTLMVGTLRLTWAVKVLSLLVCASFKNDKFGVVQTSLDEVISTLLCLYDGLEKLDRRWTRKDNAAEGEQLRNQLKNSVRQGLYRITITYADTLKCLNLSNSEHAKLQQFSAFEVL